MLVSIMDAFGDGSMTRDEMIMLANDVVQNKIIAILGDLLPIKKLANKVDANFKAFAEAQGKVEKQISSSGRATNRAKEAVKQAEKKLQSSHEKLNSAKTLAGESLENACTKSSKAFIENSLPKDGKK